MLQYRIFQLCDIIALEAVFIVTGFAGRVHPAPLKETDDRSGYIKMNSTCVSATVHHKVKER